MQSGIGEELTRELIRKGWKVAALDIAAQSSLGEKLGQEFGADFIYLPCDVSKYAELADAFLKCLANGGESMHFAQTPESSTEVPSSCSTIAANLSTCA